MKRILRKVKAGCRKVFSLGLRKTYARITKIGKPAKQRLAVRKLPIGATVGEAKFLAPSGLPSGYAQDIIVLQVRDPRWIHAYWEITEHTRKRLYKEFPAIISGNFKRVLRVYDISQINFTGNNAHRFFDIEINLESNNWYIDTQGPGRSWCVDFGLVLGDGNFVTVMRSNTVSTPLDGPSCITDEEWMVPEEMFTRLYGMGVGMGSSPLKLKRLFYVSSPVKKD